LIESFWTVCPVLFGFIVAFIGASWMMRKYKDENQKKYKDEIMEINSIIYSSKIVPAIIQLFDEAKTELGSNKQSFDDILAQEKYVSYIREITNSENIVADIKYQYKNLQIIIKKLSNNLLYCGIILAIFSVYYILDLKTYVIYYDVYVIMILILSILFNLIQSWNDYQEHNKLKDYLSEKYDEIVIGIE